MLTDLFNSSKETALCYFIVNILNLASWRGNIIWHKFLCNSTARISSTGSGRYFQINFQIKFILKCYKYYLKHIKHVLYLSIIYLIFKLNNNIYIFWEICILVLLNIFRLSNFNSILLCDFFVYEQIKESYCQRV